MIHLATGLTVRDGRLLMVASRYANHAEPLWNLPGGRQLPGELLAETAVREVFEEAGVQVEAGEVAYVSESYDGDVHYLNVTFVVAVRPSPFDSARSASSAQGDNTLAPARRAVLSERSESKGQGDNEGRWREAPGDHVVAVEWVPIDEVAERIVVAVVREPLLAYLRGELPQRYAGFHRAGVTIEWPADSR